MRRLRLVVTVIAAALLSLGYAASQYAWFTGQAASYASWVDQPVVAALALLVLLAAVCLGLVPESDEVSP